MGIYRASPLPPLSTYLSDSLFGTNAAAPGSDGTLGVGHDPLDERQKTIDNSALRCYKSTNTTCIFIDSGLPDIARFAACVKSEQSISHPNLNVMCC